MNACTPRDPPSAPSAPSAPAATEEEPNQQTSVEEQLSPMLLRPDDAPTVTTTAPPPNLDLSREHIETIVAEQDDHPVTETNSGLPDLFSQAERDKTMSVNGRLLTKDEADSMLDTVEGAEIKFEIKTQ